MSKRAGDEVDGNQAYLKRQKLSKGPVSTPVSTEEIYSVRQLRQLVAFDQDLGRARHGIQSFKVFLDGLSEDDKLDRISILTEFLQTQTPRDDDEKEGAFLSDVMLTWGLASQANNESLLSAVPAVLALLLKTLSGRLELAEYGLRLGRTVLQKAQLELLARGLTATKTKDFVISPCLRLLREIVIFDGGVLAKAVFRAKESTFKGLGRNLGIRYLGEGVEDRRKPSIRTNALRFLLACIKFLPTEGKKELLKQRDLVAGATREIGHDPPHVVVDFLDTVRIYILQDEKLPRDAKLKLLNSTGLGRLVNLYGYNQQDDEIPEGAKSVDTLVHEFLLLACTSSKTGLLHHQTGFYPRGIKPDGGESKESTAFIDLGLDSIEWADKFTDKIPVYNSTLSEFIQTLRPWSNTQQAELLVAILKAAPELVADYFFGKKSFTFEPKLTATWMGYAAVLFSTLQLPLPAFFGHQDKYARLPPSTSIVIESILPQPMTQKVMTKCLGQKDDTITFFAMRILIVAFEKMQDTLNRYREAAVEMSPLWDQAAVKLTNEFCHRCPLMKDAVLAFRNTPETSLMQRQAGSKLLAMYYEVVPQVALEAKFDVSGSLSQTLSFLEGTPKSDDTVMRVVEAENLFSIAHYSPGMRWFNKAELLSISPFTTMLKLAAEATSDVPLKKIQSILDTVAIESDILQSETSTPAIDALVVALKASQLDRQSSDIIYEYLDNCILRCCTAPIKYIDAVDREVTAAYGSEKVVGASKPISLLLLAIVEQWPFVVKSGESAKSNAVASFIANYFAASIEIHEDKKVIKSLIKSLAAETPEGTARKTISGAKKLAEVLKVPERSKAVKPKASEKAASKDLPTQDRASIEAVMAEVPAYDEDDNSALLKWTTKEIDEVMEEGHVSALILLLSSPHLSVRKEAFTNVSKLAHKLKESSYIEKEQIWILLCELLESARPRIDNAALPTTISVFATHALAVLQDPLHCLYAKLNKFLSQGPTWELEKIPLAHVILNEAPGLDDARWQEIHWLITYLTDALRSSTALEIFRKRRIFEKLMGLYGNVYISKAMKEMILKVLYTATTIDGGSDTLITRFGVVGWVKAQRGLEKGTLKVWCDVLLERTLSTCGKERVEAWSGKSIQDLLNE